MNDSSDSRYAPPQARLEDLDNQPRSGALARRSTRFWAAMVDVAVGVTVYYLAYWLLPFMHLGRHATGWLALNWQSALTGFVFFVLLHGYLLATRGQTIGKTIFRIRIVRPDGSPASAGQMVMRYGVGSLANVVSLLGLVFSLADCLLIFQASRRCLHDLIAGTIVVQS
jgi:uncharacterized RDD family membrane protein YckC